MTCDACSSPATWRAYATYNADHGENVHPLHARYPMPLIRACDAHLPDAMRADGERGGSTRQWLIVPTANAVMP